MACLREKHKKKGGPAYYSIVTSKRVPGKKYPQEVTLEYIGSEEKLIEFANKCVKKLYSDDPLGARFSSIRSYSFGSIYALEQITKRLDLIELFDCCFKSKMIQNFSRGQILLLFIFHRILEPNPTRSFYEWAKETTLPYDHEPFPQELKVYDFGDALSQISQQEIDNAQELFLSKVSQYFPNIDYNAIIDDFLEQEKERQELSIELNPYDPDPRTHYHLNITQIGAYEFICMVAHLLGELLVIKFNENDFNFTQETLFLRLAEIRKFMLVDLAKNRSFINQTLDEEEQKLMKIIETI